MSKINPALYSSEAHDWQTPPEFIDALLKFQGIDRFALDPCCTERNIPADQHYVDGASDGLILPWFSPAFVNPPYGDQLKHWLKKCVEESFEGISVWALIPARTETLYQHQHGLCAANFTVFLKGRLHFLKNGQRVGSAPFPAMLLYYGRDGYRVARQWQENPPWPGTLMMPGVVGR